MQQQDTRRRGGKSWPHSDTRTKSRFVAVTTNSSLVAIHGGEIFAGVLRGRQVAGQARELLESKVRACSIASPLPAKTVAAPHNAAPDEGMARQGFGVIAEQKDQSPLARGRDPDV